MTIIPSAIPPRVTARAFPLQLDIRFNLVTEKRHAIFDVTSVVNDVLHSGQGIPPELEDYFKNLGEEIKKNMDSIVARVQQIDWGNKMSILDGLKPILDYLKPVFEYVEKNPWILIPLLIPLLGLFLGILGFTAGGVLLGSIAAVLQSRIGNVPKGSLFAFLQSTGARGWAFKALARTNIYITIAILLVVVIQLLIDRGIIKPDAVENTVEDTWNHILEKFSAGAPSAGSQLEILRLDGNWVRYGILSWVLMYSAVCASEGL